MSDQSQGPSWWQWAALAATLSFVMLAGCTGDVDPPTSAMVTVPLTGVIGDYDAYGIPSALIEVGGSKPLRVLLDTGSVGLRVIQSDVMPLDTAKIVTHANLPISVMFGDNVAFRGVEATAKVKVGSLTTVTPVPLQLVTSVTCPTNDQSCPDKTFDVKGSAGGIDGILGIGLFASNDHLVNVLEYLPGKYGDSWSVHMAPGRVGQLTLGASSPQHSSAVIRFQSVKPGPGQLVAWDDSPNLCWTVGTNFVCGLSVFDSASVLAVVSDKEIYASSHPGLKVNGENVRFLYSGESVALHVGTSTRVDWSFKSGGLPGWNFVETTAPQSTSGVLMVMGVQVFYAETVTYNRVQGVLTLS